MALPLIEIVAAFAAANFVSARFEKVARASVATGVLRGMTDLGSQLDRSRAGALADVPVTVRLRIRQEIDSGLAGAGLTRAELARNLRDLQALRELASTLTHVRRLG